MRKLLNPQDAVLEYIISYSDAHSYPPTIREICAELGLKSTSTVHAHIKTLEERGLIKRDGKKQRAITLSKTSEGADPDAFAHSGTVRRPVPLVGRVAAGQPILAEDNIEDAFPLPEAMLHGSNAPDVFMLRIEGDSMLNAGIRPGDMIVVNSSLGCEDGDIVVARVEGESATVKRLFREKAQVRLQPENDLYAPIYVPYEDVEIVGKVTGLLRQF